MTEVYDAIAEAVRQHGLAARGGFVALPDDAVPECAADSPTATVVMIGNNGRAMWDAFGGPHVAGPNPLDRWTCEVIGPIARKHGARAVYPFDKPALPFQRWARRAWPLFTSPLGLLIDTEFGLWHALRTALLFDHVLPLPASVVGVSPCDSCVGKPCLSTCPVDAFSAQGFDYVGCRTYLATPTAHRCRDEGCGARNACPIGTSHTYSAEQSRFHMRAFRG